MTDRELLQMALDALQLVGLAYLTDDDIDRLGAYEEHLRARLAQPEREWAGLTDEEILADDVLRYHFALNGGAGPISKKGRAIIAAVNDKLRDKNS